MASPLDLIKQESENKELYLPKTLELANSLFQAFIQKNNVIGLKIAIFLSGARKQISYTKDNRVELNIKELCSICNFEKRDLSRNLSKIGDIKFKFVNKEGGLGETHPIHTYQYKNRNKVLELEISSIAQEIFIELGKGRYSFSKADANNIMRLKHKHSVRFQLLLEQINNFTTVKRKHYTLEELNGYFGTNYKNYYELERRIIKPVKEEIDNNSNLTFIYQVVDEAHGTGRPKIKHITIDLIEQKNIQGRLL